MRKFGVRALACGLAAVLVAGSVAPAAANAEDVLLVAAPDSVETLYITEDMVDSDGEIVISGEDWDRVVISKEAAAKDIYFDQVNIGELVVESGSTSNIQLWEVEAEKLTVTEPELNPLTISDLRSLLADPETQHMAVDLYLKNAAQNEETLKKAPSIVTMQDAKIGEVSTRANVVFDFAEGSVGAVALEASEQLERVNVTLKNYDGEVSYKGGESVSITTLKMVDSNISKLTVDESAANNYLNVDSKNSSASSVEIAGNAQVALNVQATELEIAEEATKAQVAVMNKVKKMNVAADGAQVEVAPGGNVSSATVEGDNVNIVGGGTLKEVDITGKGAYVSTEGTVVEGENSYVKPVYESPKVEITDIDLVGGEGAVVTKNSDGSATVVYTPNYKTATFKVPESVDKDRISSVVIEANYDTQFCVKFGGTNKADDYPGYGTTSAKDETFTYLINSATQKLSALDFMCLEAPLKLTIKKITFHLLDKAPEVAPTPEPAQPSELSNEYVVYPVADLTAGGYGYSESEAAHGGKTYSFNDKWQEVQYELPTALTIGDFEKMIVTMAYTTSDIALKLLDAEGQQISVWYGKSANDTTDVEVSLSGKDGADTTIPTNKKVAYVAVMSGSGACDATVFRVAFLSKDGSGSTGGGSTGGVDLTGATECTTNDYQVHHFTDYNLVEYAGQTISFSVDMVRTSGDGTDVIVAQDSQYKAMYVETEIGGTWDTYTYTCTVPENYKDKESAYLGFRWKNGPVDNYADYTFYFKNFTFTGTKAEVKEDTVSITNKPTSTTLKVDDILELEAKASGDITWESDNTDVATVENGKVTAKKEGTVNITVSCGTASDKITLTVKDYLTVTARNNTLVLDEKLTLDVKTSGEITWESSDEDVATVTNGEVVAVGEGTVIITATCGKEFKVSVSVSLTVVSSGTKFIEIEGALEREIFVGDTLELKATTSDKNGKISWSVDDKDADAVTVDENGNVTAMQGGVTVKVTASCQGYEPAIVTLTIKDYEVSVTPEKEVLYVGETIDVNVDIEPDLGEDAIIEWTPSDLTAVEIVDGKVTAKKAGSVEITVSCKGKFTSTINLTVLNHTLEVEETEIALEVGKSKPLTVSASGKKEYESGDKKVATVDEEGNVKAEGVGTTTITVTCGNATPVIVTVTVTAAAPAGGSLCEPNDIATEVMIFTADDLREYAGTKVKISVDMIKTGGEEDAYVHAQLNNANYKQDGSGQFEPIVWDVYITDQWKTYEYEYQVPIEFADLEAQEKPINFGFRKDDKVDYSAYTFYYKNYKFEEVVVDESKEFVIAEDDFELTVVEGTNGTTTEIVKVDLYPWEYEGNTGNKFVDLLPDALKADEAMAEKFTTLEGIMEVVDYFEFHVTLTQGSSSAGNSWEPQAQVVAQSSDYANGTWDFPYETLGKELIGGIGEPKEGETKEVTVKLPTSFFEGWNGPSLNYVGLQIIDVKLGTALAGSYSIKVVLK